MLTQVPAYVALGMWILMQLVESSGIFGGSSEGGGVAYAAHIGGFIVGILFVKLFIDDKSKPSTNRNFYQ
jgi:membrane associated rhomboid family serine protease